eukprot:GHUV01008276.1.p1 GENE.GHUV01008276.1~~GHUV01008276.1.p1  ORF type:complete len:481 (+),score=169.26 GHUV01008276.1:824-2266(+)
MQKQPPTLRHNRTMQRFNPNNSCPAPCADLQVLAFIMGRGVLVLPLSLPQFAAVMLAPFMPAQLVASRLSMYTAPPEDKQEGSKTADTARSTPDSSGHGGSLWQQVTPTQRVSIDSSRHSTDSSRSSDSRWSTESSTSPKAGDAAPGPQHAVHTLVASSLSRGDMAPAAPTAEPESSLPHSSSKRRRSLQLFTVANFLLNAAVVAAFAVYTCHTKQRMISTSVSIAGLWVMWRAMECVMRAASTPARTFLGMTLAPHFRNPFASSSLTDFWARRWNITQGLVLRFFVYEPIVQARWVPESAMPGKAAAAAAAAQARTEPADSGDSSIHDSSNSMGLRNRKGVTMDSDAKRQHAYASADVAPAGKAVTSDPSNMPVLAAPSRAYAPRWRGQLAAAATFVVSGIEHEIFMAYITHTWGWKWFVFFSLQGLFLALEGSVKRRCSKLGLRLHPRVAILAVLLALGVVGDVFFWPVLVQPSWLNL